MAGEHDDDDNVVLEQPVVADTGQQSEPDDGLTAEERGQFEEMRKAETGPPAEGAEPPAGAKPDAVVTKPNTAADGADDDDDDETADVAAQNAAQADPNAKPKRIRMSAKRYEAMTSELETLRKQTAAGSEERARIDERLKIINEALTTRPAPQEQEDEDPEPDIEQDFIEHGKWLSRQNKRLGEENKALREGGQQQNVQAQVATAYRDDASNFQAQEPAFPAAYQHLMMSRVAELAMYYFDKDASQPGFNLTPQEIAKIRATVQSEERDIVQNALRDGKSPSQRIYNLSKARGFNKATWEQQRAAGANGQQQPAGNGAAKPNGAAAPGSLAEAAAGATDAVAKTAAGNSAAAAPSVKDEIDRIKRGQEASVSLSSGGGSPSLVLTAEKLANMPEEEFGQLIDRLSPAELKRLFPGA